jgi:hypothetical protein|tara:strand:- start:3169 stop:3957 length:789 start_codon:yes stop_codon:yes gene_type:complete
MAKVHRVGDFDSAGNMSATGSENVFVNGGPTLGGALAEVFDLPDAVGVSDFAARMILSDRADEINRGEIDPDTNEPLEQYDSASGKGINPINGSTSIVGAPGSPAGGTSGGFNSSASEEAVTTPFDNSITISDWLRPEPQVNMGVNTDTFNKTVKLAKALGRPLIINSAYRPPEYNKKIGGAKKSMHVDKKAVDIRWPSGDFTSRTKFIQMAIDAGFTGIGVYNGFMHCDTGAKRCWGPSGGRASVYQQYVATLKKNGYTVG